MKEPFDRELLMERGCIERSDIPHPLGGDYTEAWYMDTAGNLVHKSEAAIVFLKRFKADGTQVGEDILSSEKANLKNLLKNTQGQDQERISRLGQMKVYVGKCWRAFRNERGWKLLVSAGVIAVIIAWVSGFETFVTLKATRSGAFAMICACIWIGVFNSIQSICRERAIIKREYRTGLHISSYVAAHCIYEAILCLAEALIVTAILFLLRGGPEGGIILPAFLELFVTFFLVLLGADFHGIAVSSIVKNETAAMTAMPFVLILQLVLSGTVFELQGVSTFLSNLTVSKWGVLAVCSIANITKMPDARILGGYDASDFAHEAGHLLTLWFVLAFFALLYAIVAAVSLKMIDRDQR